MKWFHKKVVFGISMLGLLQVAGIFLLLQPDPVSMFIPLAFIYGFTGGIIYWLAINLKEARRRKEENFRRKNQ